MHNVTKSMFRTEIYEAKQEYQKAKDSLECAVNYRAKLENQLSNAKSNELLAAQSAQFRADRLTALEEDFVKCGGTFNAL